MDRDEYSRQRLMDIYGVNALEDLVKRPTPSLVAPRV